MKLNGQVLDGPKIEVVVFPRQSGDLVFKAQAVLDYSEFEKICPRPEPKNVMRPGGKQETLVDHPEYVAAVEAWAPKQTSWMILKSLEATPGLVWDTVDMGDPLTWDNYEKELKNAGFSTFEIHRILDAVITACGMNQEKIDDATKRFLAGQEASAES